MAMVGHRWATAEQGPTAAKRLGLEDGRQMGESRSRGFT
uniref:Uncharacterized protein n=1 Tax=Nelumbo nucifera TaxID=4432 RepID=A0A822YU62_NELNU|nr:TPA_asm: hypothetical protein HUJ06_005599 [Nelumbo nucifera]